MFNILFRMLIFFQLFSSRNDFKQNLNLLRQRNVIKQEMLLKIYFCDTLTISTINIKQNWLMVRKRCWEQPYHISKVYSLSIQNNFHIKLFNHLSVKTNLLNILHFWINYTNIIPFLTSTDYISDKVLNLFSIIEVDSLWWHWIKYR